MRRSFRVPIPSATRLAVLILALSPGVVECTAPSAYPRPDTLVGVGPAFPELGRPLAFREVLSGPEYLDVAGGSVALERVVAWDLGRRQAAGRSAPERLLTAFWWSDPLPTLEVRPLLGRSFLIHELEGRAKVAMLSERAWQRLFGRDPGAIGGTVEVEGEPYNVIGILPAEVLVDDTDLWLPMWAAAADLPRERRQFQILARIRAGQTLAGVNAELAEIARRVQEAHVVQHDEYAGWTLEARAWDEIVRGRADGR
jgi:hypothetical protein